MARIVALLRGINVGGQRPVAMADIRAAVAGLGYDDAVTLLNTGNVLFSADATTGAGLEHELEEALAAKVGLRTDIMVRTAAEWRALVAQNPYLEMARDDPAHLVALVLKAAPPPGAEAAVRARNTGPEAITVVGTTAYVTYPAGIGRSKFNLKPLAVPGTARNWNTVLKIAVALGE